MFCSRHGELPSRCEKAVMGGKRASVFAEDISSCLNSVTIPLYSYGGCMVDISCFGMEERA